jgi:hypothetical protein
MEQNINIELNWRDAEWRDIFFTYFIEDLRVCDSENLEPNPQNIEEYNSTRETCQFILNYYLTRVDRIVTEMESTETPREVVQDIIDRLEEQLTHHIFEGIVDQRTEEVITNPMLQGNNQEWSELSLVNHYNRLWSYYMRVIQYINRENNSGNVGGRRRKKYKSRKANKKNKKAKKKSRKANKKKSKKSKK